MKSIARSLVFFMVFSTMSAISFGQEIDLGMFDQYKWDKNWAVADADKIAPDTYPNADTIMVCDRTVDYYQADASYVTWMDTYEKVLTEKGKRSKQVVSLPYNETYSSWDVSLLEIIKPDGTSTVIDIASRSKEMIDRSQMSMNIYDPAQKILQIGLSGVEIGDVIHMTAASKQHKPRAKGIWCGFQTFESDSPIRNFVYEIHECPELPLRLIQIKDPVDGTVTASTRQENGRKVYRWEVKNVPQIFVEPSMPAYYTVTQRLLVSTASDWKEVSRWYYGLCEPYLAPNDDMKAKVQELIADCTTRQEKIEAVFKFVSQEIRYLGIIPEGEDEAPGYQPHYVTQTFENRHGVCRDKAALLATMLRLAGFEAFPVLIKSGPKMDMEVPLPYFNHAITSVLNDDGSYTLMDSTDENTKELFPAYLCDMSYLVARPEGEVLKVSDIVPAEENLMLVDTVGKITAQGTLEASCHLQFNGINDNIYRSYFARANQEERRKFFESVIKGAVAGATLGDCKIQPADMLDTTKPLDVELGFTAENVLIGQGDTIMVPTISLDRSVGMANFVLRGTGLEKRRFPMQTRYACGVKQTMEIELDPSIGKAVSIPAYDKINDDIITLDREYQFNDGKITGQGTFFIKLTEVDPEQYLALKEHLRTMEYNDRKMTVFARPSEEATADVVYNNVEHDYVLTDNGSWTETVTVKELIKTYSGKKSNAELQLNYNEAWESIELLEARVTNGDKVKEITKDEINIMDAGWVASAPRYPASKTMVASLPGVEIGSVIEYKYRRTVTGMPFFAMSEVFASQDPIKHKTVTISMPEKLKCHLLVDDNGVTEADVDGDKKITRDESIADGIVTYTFTADDLALIPREDSMAPAFSYMPVVMISTGDWKDYSHNFKKCLDKAVSGQKNVKAKARELVKSVKGRKEKAIVIRDFVARNIRRVGPGAGAITNDAVTDADITLADGYGNSTDSAIVLYAMAKAAGLSPEFILGGYTSRVEALCQVQLDYSGASLFGAVLVRVKIDGDYVYLNDTDQYDHLGVTGYDDCPVIELSKGRITELDLADDLESRSYQEYNISISTDGDADFMVSTSVQGASYGSRKRMFVEMMPENRDRYVQQLVTSVSQGATLTEELQTSYDSYPGVEKFTVAVDKYAVCDGDSIYFEIPNGLPVLGLSADEHESPYYIHGPLEKEVKVHVELPAGYSELLMAPESNIWQLPCNAGTISIEVISNEGTSLDIIEKVSLNDAIIAPEYYGQLLEIDRQISHKDMEMILVRKPVSAN